MLNVFYEMWRNGCLIRRRLSGKTEEKDTQIICKEMVTWRSAVLYFLFSTLTGTPVSTLENDN